MKHAPQKEVIEFHIKRDLRAPKWKVFGALLRLSEFEKVMPSIKESKVLETQNRSNLIKWHINIEGMLPIKWIERNVINRHEYTLSFKSIDGDLKMFEGKWKVSGSGDSSILELDARLDTGIPLLERLVGPVLKERMRRNFDIMIDAVDHRLRDQFYKSHLPKKLLHGYGLIGHPYNYEHMVRYLRSLNPGMKIASREFLGKLFELTPSHKCYDIAPIVSPTGRKSVGHFIMCPIVPDMLEINLEAVFEKVVHACKVAEDFRVGIVTLGGFTSIAGERFGKEIHKQVSVPITTGNTFTAALAVEGVLRGCERMGTDLSKATLAVIGGTGDIGAACARYLAEKVANVILVARNVAQLKTEQGVIERIGKAKVTISSDINMSISDADIVIAAASASQSFIDPKNFKSGAVVCDIGYPKNIYYLLKGREDLLIFSGGLCSSPSDFDLGVQIDYGLPTNRVLYGCFAEAIVLDLEKRYEAFSTGRGNITKEKMDDVMVMAHRNGFKLAPFFWGDKLMGEQEFENIRDKVKR